MARDTKPDGVSTFRIADYRRGESARSPCPRCGELIPGQATMCRHCGVHLAGHAVDFAPDVDREHVSGRGMIVVLKVIAGVIGVFAAMSLIVYIVTSVLSLST